MKIEALNGKRKKDLVGTSLRIEKVSDDELVRIAAEEDVSKSELLRYIINAFIDDYNKR